MMATVFENDDQRLAYALLRIVVGLNLLMHGVSRMLAGPGTFAAHMVGQFAHAPLPVWSVWSFGMVLPAIEALLGLLLLIGLRTRAALVAASLLIMVLTFGSGLLQEWSTVGSQLIYALVYSVLLFLLRYNGWSVDAWMLRSNKQASSPTV
ncbi:MULTISPECIES: MauE/DoxX family redox-associated membrane protein [Acidobacteriaceae]|uniref:MauE/DoxX family redox-associated membrane protein n=1 Tax=Acidobacteriaceae TaxID=204434 RepID=UPI00131B983A|nr:MULTISPECIES: MauE/DoxX family redox-associated membrane protein [Acidobacteriaceae]MDW5265298.1 DoxX family membrane protein [Edaphobacter sp.]